LSTNLEVVKQFKITTVNFFVPHPMYAWGDELRMFIFTFMYSYCYVCSVLYIPFS